MDLNAGPPQGSYGDRVVLELFEMTRHSRADRVAATVEAVDRFLGGRIRQLRLEAGLSQAALAERCGVAYQQLAKYERGENGVSAARLFLLAEALGATPATLFDGLDELLGAPGSRDEAALAARLRENDERAQIADAFRRITDRRTRELLMTLSRELAGKR